MTDGKSETTILSDDALRGRPKMMPCAWCGASREGQVRISYYTVDKQPLCQRCWETEYNNGEADDDA